MGQFNLISEETFSQKMDEQNQLLAGILEAQGGDIFPKSWGRIQYIVRQGKAPQYFPVGYEFTTHDNTNDTDIIWRVVGYDTIQAADESLSHTMILEMKYVYSNSSGRRIILQADGPEAIYYAQDGLNAGTYYITLPSGYAGKAGNPETSISFTLAQPIPAGGVIVLDLPFNATITGDTEIRTFSDQTAADPIETVIVSIGTNGENLGIADGSAQNLNHCDRASGGSNNYAQCALRQFLNSSANTGDIWNPQTKFDRPPTWVAEQAGFMTKFSADFLSVVQPAIVKCYTNNKYEINSLDGTVFTTNQTYTLNDKFFLLSRSEIYDSGERLEFYEDLTNAEKIKYDKNGNNVYDWLRTPDPYSSTTLNYISGIYGTSSGSNAALSTPSFTAACIIA